jgi:hypothetical protein
MEEDETIFEALFWSLIVEPSIDAVKKEKLDAPIPFSDFEDKGKQLIPHNVPRNQFCT